MSATLETSWIIRKKPGEKTGRHSCEFKQLTTDHLDQLMDLQSLIVSRLSRGEMLQAFPMDFMREHLEGKGFVIGACVGKKIVAFRNVYFPDPKDREWNLGFDVGFGETDLKRSANLQMVCVHPEYRGNELALKMNRHAIRMIKERNIFDHLFATVSPYNYWNLSILLNSGFVIKTMKKKYGGKLRYIVYQHLNGNDLQFPEPEKSTRLTDFEKQAGLFRAGYCGVRLQEPFRNNAEEKHEAGHRVLSDLIDEFELLFALPFS